MCVSKHMLQASVCNAEVGMPDARPVLLVVDVRAHAQQIRHNVCPQHSALLSIPLLAHARDMTCSPAAFRITRPHIPPPAHDEF